MTVPDDARQAFRAQRSNAKRRGIEWRLTFEQWLAWWGDGLPKRGVKAWSLQMQRMHDAGAYELGNIVKGRPADNARTARNVRIWERTQQAAADLNSRLDAAMFEDSDEVDDEIDPDDLPISEAMARKASVRASSGMAGVFAQDKSRRR